MNSKYISKFAHISEHNFNKLEGLIKSKAPKNVLEIGTHAGQITLLLSELSNTVISIDYKEFHSPSVEDHLKINNINNVEVYKGDSLSDLIVDHFNQDIDLIYIHRDLQINDLPAAVKKKCTKDVSIIKLVNDDFVIDKISPPAKKKKPAKTPVIDKSVSGVS